MAVYNEEYLHKHFDQHDFFLPECKDIRTREINMRTKRCLVCPGLKDCKHYPQFWLKSEMAKPTLSD